MLESLYDGWLVPPAGGLPGLYAGILSSIGRKKGDVIGIHDNDPPVAARGVADVLADLDVGGVA